MERASMDTDDEVIDLRRKYTELSMMVKSLAERIMTLESTVKKSGELGIQNSDHIRGLERDFDQAAGKQIAANRKLQDQIDTLSTNL